MTKSNRFDLFKVITQIGYIIRGIKQILSEQNIAEAILREEKLVLATENRHSEG